MNKLSFTLPPHLGDYYYWIQVNKYNKNQEKYYKYLLNRDNMKKPLISIVIPAYNTDVSLLELTLKSIYEQVYENWEIILVNDGSTDNNLINYLNNVKHENLFIYHTENGGISNATNKGVELAKGDFIALVDHDDTLHPAALAEIVLAHNRNPQVNLFYTDSDKIDLLGRCYDPRFKPDFSPELLLSYMYAGHLTVLLKSLYQKVGGFEKQFDGAQDYHFMLKCLLLDEGEFIVKHIPKILYHWRASETSLALSADTKPESVEKGRLALQNFLDEKCKKENLQSISCDQYPWAELSKCGYYKVTFNNNGPLVTIIIPIKDKVDLLINCINSIVEKTSYKNYKILVVDNGSTEKKTLSYLSQNKHLFDVLTVETEAFNFSKINNEAVKYVNSEYILFLNNDVKILNKDWLTNLMGFIQFKDIGAVGARLLFPDGTIQHAGLVNGLNSKEGCSVKTALRNQISSAATYSSAERVIRNTTGVTAACLLTRKDLFEQVGGFDETNFKVGYNDPDLCMKLLKLNKRIVYSPDTHIVHYEGKTRQESKKRDDLLDNLHYKTIYKNIRDPFYNDNFDKTNADYRVNGRVVIMEKDCPKFKVAAISYNLNYEGSSFSQYELITGLKKLTNIEFIIYSSQDGPLKQMYEEQGIKVNIFPSVFTGGYNYYVYQEGIKRLKESFVDENIDTVYCNTIQTFYGIDAAKQLLLPSIWNIRESEPIDSYFSNFGPQIAFIALECFFHTYKNIFVSFSSRSGCEKFNCKNNFEVIHNGLNPTRFNLQNKINRTTLNIKEDDIVYINVGTVCDRKNQIETLKALSVMTEKEIQGIKVLIVGIRHKLPYYTKFIKVYNELPQHIKSAVILVDETDNVADYYTLSDVFVCNTLMESYPRVILEALYFNLPIITTPVNGITEQLSDLCSNFYNPGDHEMLKNTMLLFKNNEFRKSKKEFCNTQLNSLTSYDEMLAKYQAIFIETYLSGVSR